MILQVFPFRVQAAGPLRTANEEVDFAGAAAAKRLFFWGFKRAGGCVTRNSQTSL